MNGCCIPYKNVLLNIVFHSYGIIFIAVSINNIVDMNSNKQFVKTHVRKHVNIQQLLYVNMSLVPSDESLICLIALFSKYFRHCL